MVFSRVFSKALLLMLIITSPAAIASGTPQIPKNFIDAISKITGQSADQIQQVALRVLAKHCQNLLTPTDQVLYLQNSFWFQEGSGVTAIRQKQIHENIHKRYSNASEGKIDNELERMTLMADLALIKISFLQQELLTDHPEAVKALLRAQLNLELINRWTYRATGFALLSLVAFKDSH